MAKEWETELKLHFLDEGRWSDIFTSSVVTLLAVSPPTVDQLEAQYFDTDSRSLQKAGIAYRIRKENGQWVATVKGSGSGDAGLHQRQEWNVMIDAPIPASDYFKGTPISKNLCEAIGEAELKPQYITRFARQYVELRTEDGSLVELAADQGEILVGEKKAPIRELELELKEGKPSALLNIGAELAADFPVLPEWRSKYYRALVLAGAAEPEDRKMLRISENEPAVQGLPRLIIDRMHWLFAAENRCLSQLASAESILSLSEAFDSLAVMLDLSHGLFDEAECTAAYDEITQLKEQMEMLCSIDRSLVEWHEMLEHNTLEIQGKPVLEGFLTDNRDKKAVLLMNKLANSKSTSALLKFWGTLIDREGLVPEGEQSVSVGSIVQQRANAWLGDTDVCQKQPSIEDDAVVKLLYDRCGRLRNALAAMSVGGAKVRRMLPRAEKAFASLSCLYDFFEMQMLLKEMLRTQSSRLMYRDTGLLTGWQGHKTYKTRMKTAKRWKKLRQLIRFWIG